MTYQSQLDKDRKKAYCSQCYDAIRLRCPFCLLEKTSRHCKIYKNTAALWWHIKQHHDNSVTSRFDMNTVLDALNGITLSLQWGIIVN